MVYDRYAGIKSLPGLDGMMILSLKSELDLVK